MLLSSLDDDSERKRGDWRWHTTTGVFEAINPWSNFFLIPFWQRSFVTALRRYTLGSDAFTEETDCGRDVFLIIKVLQPRRLEKFFFLLSIAQNHTRINDMLWAHHRIAEVLKRLTNCLLNRETHSQTDWRETVQDKRGNRRTKPTSRLKEQHVLLLFASFMCVL